MIATTTGWPWGKITVVLIVFVLLLAVVGYVGYDKFLHGSHPRILPRMKSIFSTVLSGPRA
jgi:hypothetical protein